MVSSLKYMVNILGKKLFCKFQITFRNRSGMKTILVKRQSYIFFSENFLKVGKYCKVDYRRLIHFEFLCGLIVQLFHTHFHCAYQPIFSWWIDDSLSFYSCLRFYLVNVLGTFWLELLLLPTLRQFGFLLLLGPALKDCL